MSNTNNARMLIALHDLGYNFDFEHAGQGRVYISVSDKTQKPLFAYEDSKSFGEQLSSLLVAEGFDPNQIIKNNGKIKQ